MGYKNINGLMRHLRNNGISIAGSTQKRQLMNTGYFHGYKGYRFFYLYTLKDLRNAIAHNSVVFDTRFRHMDSKPAMRKCLMQEIGLPYVNFKTIGDYLILVCYYLKILNVTKTEIKAFIRDFEAITDEYQNSVSPQVAMQTIHPDLGARLTQLKNFL